MFRVPRIDTRIEPSHEQLMFDITEFVHLFWVYTVRNLYREVWSTANTERGMHNKHTNPHNSLYHSLGKRINLFFNCFTLTLIYGHLSLSHVCLQPQISFCEFILLLKHSCLGCPWRKFTLLAISPFCPQSCGQDGAIPSQLWAVQTLAPGCEPTSSSFICL